LSIAKCQVYSQDTRRHRACGRRNGHGWPAPKMQIQYKIQNTIQIRIIQNTRPPLVYFPSLTKRAAALRLNAPHDCTTQHTPRTPARTAHRTHRISRTRTRGPRPHAHTSRVCAGCFYYFSTARGVGVGYGRGGDLSRSPPCVRGMSGVAPSYYCMFFYFLCFLSTLLLFLSFYKLFPPTYTYTHSPRKCFFWRGLLLLRSMLAREHTTCGPPYTPIPMYIYRRAGVVVRRAVECPQAGSRPSSR
jgi:hypothetical protein